MVKSEKCVQAMDEKMAEYGSDHFFSGLLRVTHKDEILYQKCVGIEDPKTNLPISEQSRFTFYSLSKPFCALGLMKLVDKGLVSLCAHPGTYVPEAVDFDEGVTLYHMLHHTSGMTDFIDREDYMTFVQSKEVIDMRTAVYELSQYPRRFAPGTNTQYANINFALTSLIIENVTHMSYEDYMQTEVLDPLGMKTAVMDRPGRVLTHRVVGFDKDGDRLYPVEPSTGWLKGAGDINGTVEDVYCLNQAIKHKRLVSENAWKEILTPSPINAFGCGCSITDWHGKRRITHNGGHIGFRTLHIQLPEEDFDMILLSNYGFGTVREDISEMVYEVFLGQPLEGADALAMDGRYIR